MDGKGKSSAELVSRFRAALQGAEERKDAAPLLALFGEDAELSNLSGEPRRGRAGARAFWEAYLGNFEEVRSRFTHVIEGEGGAALEWVSEGGCAPTGPSPMPA